MTNFEMVTEQLLLMVMKDYYSQDIKPGLEIAVEGTATTEAGNRFSLELILKILPSEKEA